MILTTALHFFIGKHGGLPLLNDIEELKPADMNTIYDRSDEPDKWFEEHEDFSDWYLDKND